jgi:hypothetical protein
MDDFRPVAFETPPSHTPRDTAQRDFVLVLLPAPDYNTNVKFPPPFFLLRDDDWWITSILNNQKIKNCCKNKTF